MPLLNNLTYNLKIVHGLTCKIFTFVHKSNHPFCYFILFSRFRIIIIMVMVFCCFFNCLSSRLIIICFDFELLFCCSKVQVFSAGTLASCNTLPIVICCVSLMQQGSSFSKNLIQFDVSQCWMIVINVLIWLYLKWCKIVIYCVVPIDAPNFRIAMGKNKNKFFYSKVFFF